MTGNTDMHLLVTDTFKKSKGVETIQYLVWPPLASCSATHLLWIELMRLFIVACGMLSHFSSMAVRSCWILAGTGKRCLTRQLRASQTCSVVTCLVNMQTMEELGHFQLLGIVYRSLWHGAVHYNAETWGADGGWMARQWASGSHHGISALKCNVVFVVCSLCLPIP